MADDEGDEGDADDNDDDDDDDDNDANAKPTQNSAAFLIDKTLRAISATCSKGEINIPKHKFLMVKKKLTNYFSDKCDIGVESKDRRFVLTPLCRLQFQSRAKQISMPLCKAIATFTLERPDLFSYLSTMKKGMTAFTSKDKLLLKTLARLSEINTKLIPSNEVRSFCTS